MMTTESEILDMLVRDGLNASKHDFPFPSKRELTEQRNHIVQMGTKMLDTDRLVLRRATMLDARQVFEHFGADAGLGMAAEEPLVDLAEAEKLVEGWITGYGELDFYRWVIQEKETGYVIGCISVEPVDPYWTVRDVELVIGEEWRGLGYGTEALATVSDYMFDEVGYLGLRGYVSRDNVAAMRAMSRCGYHEERKKHPEREDDIRWVLENMEKLRELGKIGDAGKKPKRKQRKDKRNARGKDVEYGFKF